MERGTLIFMSYEMGLMYKEYLVKVHDHENTFRRTIPRSQIADGSFNFTRTINSGYGPMRIRYNIAHSDFDLEVFDVVYIYCNGELIYRGFLLSYNMVNRKSAEYIDLNIVGMQAIMKYAVYESGGVKTFTKNTDPATIIDEILGYVNTQRGWTVFNTGVTSYGSNVNIEFQEDDCLAALLKVVDNTDRFIDFLPNGDVVFSAINESVADHSLTFGKNISELSREFDAIDMSNDVTVDYDGGVESDTDATSQTSYGTLEKRLSEQSIKNAATATERASVELASRKNPKEKTIVTVNSTYDLESINVGDTIRVRNKSGESMSSFKPVKRIDYREELAVLHLDDYDSMARSLLSL